MRSHARDSSSALIAERPRATTAKQRIQAQQRAAGNEETVLFDIVNVERRERRIGNGGREPIASAATHSGRGPGARLGACAGQGLFFSCYLQERESGLHPLPETRN